MRYRHVKPITHGLCTGCIFNGDLCKRPSHYLSCCHGGRHNFIYVASIDRLPKSIKTI